MEATTYIRAVEAVERSLDKAGRRGYALFHGRSLGSWFDAGILFDYLAEGPFDTVSLLWEGDPMRPYDSLSVDQDGWQRTIRVQGKHGSVYLIGDVAIALLPMVCATGHHADILVLGERRKGALQEFLNGYGTFARRQVRSEKVITVIGGDDIPRPRDCEWNDPVLPGDLQEEIRREVDGFFASREAYRHMGVPFRRGLLFAGPPGNGKTTILRTIAAQRSEPFIMLVSSSDTDQCDLNSAFDLADYYAPAILCFEDLDSLFRPDVPLSHFLNKLDGISPADGVLVLATSNHPEKLDEALTERPSRFDRIFVFENPGPAERRAYLSRKFGDAFDPRLVGWTDGLSFAHLKEVWVSACLDALREGSELPTLAGARRALDFLRGQKDWLDHGSSGDGRIGFRIAR